MTRKGNGIGYFIENSILSLPDRDDYEILYFDELPTSDIYCVYIDDFIPLATKKFIDELKKKKIV